MKLHANILVALFLLAFFIPAHPAAAATPAYMPINSQFQGPVLVANNSTHTYTLTITGGGGPAGQNNYTYSASLEASNTSGMTVTPSTGSGNSGKFAMNITFGNAEIVTVQFNITSRYAGLNYTHSMYFLIHVVKPVVIRVPVTNTGMAGVKDVNVSLFIDGRFIESVNVTLSPGQTEAITFLWLSYVYPAGEHTATVIVNSNQSLVLQNGKAEATFAITIPGNTNTLINDYLITGIFAAAFVFVLLYFRKPKPRK